jgi:signal transduction histidine kinase/PAS domain-containing protein
MASSPARKSGIAPLGEIPWGTHICHFFDSATDLVETVVPFFEAGVEQRERCVWLVSDPVPATSATAALHGLDVEVTDAYQWYLGDGPFNLAQRMAAWDVMLEDALQRGFLGLRASGCEGWQAVGDWPAFRVYEAELEQWLIGKPVILLCSYPLAAVGAADVLELARNHHIAVAKRDGAWEVLQTPDTTRLRARNLQQAAIAALGQTAIRERELSVVLNEAVALAARTLGTGRSIVWQVNPNSENVTQCARAGWDDLPVDATFPLVPGSIVGHVVEREEPVTIADLRTDERFNFSWVLREYGIVTLLSVPIRGRLHPWGVLTVHSTERRSFTDDDVEFLQSMANVLALTIERDEIERAERHKHEQVLTIFDHIPVMIAVLAPNGKFVTVNHEWAQCLGWSAEEAATLDFASMHLDHESWQRAVEYVRVADHRLSDGSAMDFGLDITVRKRTEEAKEAARAAAEAALAKLHAIKSITDTALVHLGLDEMLSELLARLRQALHSDHTTLLLLDEDRQHFTVRAIDGTRSDVMRSLPVATTSPLSGTIMREQREMIFNELPPADAPVWSAWRALSDLLPKSAMAAPLVVEGKFIGTITVTSLEHREFTNDELDLLRMVIDHAAPAIERGRLLEQIQASGKRLEALSRRLLTVQEEERRHLAVELHDQLGQIYTAVKIKLDSVMRRLDDAEASAQLGEAISVVEGAIGTVRNLALDLRPAMLDDLGLSAALRWYADRFSRQFGIEMHLALDEFPNLDPAIATVCFRTVQEALTNVARHAGARNVWLDVHAQPREMRLQVRDDGRGFDVAAARDRAVRGESLGLLGMEERVSYASGTLHVKSTLGAGTSVSAILPLPTREAV